MGLGPLPAASDCEGQLVTAKNRVAGAAHSGRGAMGSEGKCLGDCLLNLLLTVGGAAHVCEVQVALQKVETARDSLGGHDSYTYVTAAYDGTE